MIEDFPPLHGPMKRTSGLENISGSNKYDVKSNNN